MRLALAQIDTIVGDLDGNRDRIVARHRRGASGRRRPRRLSRARRSPATRRRTSCSAPAFVARGRAALREVATAADGIVALVGTPHRRRRPAVQRAARSAPTARCRRRTASACCRTTASSTRSGTSSPARRPPCSRSPARASGSRSARTSGSPARRRRTSAAAGARCSSTSRRRRSTSARTASARRCSPSVRARTRLRVVFCNAVGGQDELVFDGHSFVLDAGGDGRRARARLRGGAARRRLDDGGVRARADRARSSTTSSRCGWRSSSACATTSRRTAFGDVVIGLSGGIDSALTAALAVEALGAGARPLRVDAVPVLVRRDARRRASASPSRSASTSARSRSTRSSRRSRTRSRRASPARRATRRRRTSRHACAGRC